jgi:hypothetical protein
MSGWFNNPKVQPLEDGERDQLCARLEFCYTIGTEETTLRVPKGFVTNYASTPRILWALFPPRGPWNRAAVLHDWLYSTPGSIDRFYADATFLLAMKALRVPWWRRVLMFRAVRWFGWWYWNGGDV